MIEEWLANVILFYAIAKDYYSYNVLRFLHVYSDSCCNYFLQ